MAWTHNTRRHPRQMGTMFHAPGITMLLFLICRICCSQVFGQSTLTILIERSDPDLQVYVSGSFNNWQLTDPDFKAMPDATGRKRIVIPNLANATYQFKFNRGDWNTVETDAHCRDISNRTISLQHDTTITISALFWKDLQWHQLKGEALFEYYLGKAFAYLPHNLDSSVSYALKNYAMPEAKGNTRLAARSINIQGEIFERLGNIPRAIQLFQKALNIQTALRDTGSMAFLYSQMANALWTQKDTAAALLHCYALNVLTTELLEQHPMHDMYTNSYVQLAKYHQAKGHYDSMNYYLQKASQVGDRKSANLSLFLGDLAYESGNTDSAMLHWNEANKLSQYGSNSPKVSMEAWMKKGRAFYQLQETDSALQCWQFANELAWKTGNKVFFIESADSISNYLAKRQLKDSALQWKDRTIRFLDRDVGTERSLQTLGNVFMAQIENLEQANELKQNRFRFLLFGILALVITGAISWIWYKRRLHYRFEKRMKEVEIKALRAQMNPHFIFNCLTSINSLVVKQHTRVASEYLVRFAKLMRNILDNTGSNRVTLAAELSALQLYVDMELLRFGEAFEYQVSVCENLPTETIEIPSMIIQPYVENAIWHGLMHAPEKGKLSIGIDEKQKGLLEVTIRDNGIGREASAKLSQIKLYDHKSYGMKISQDRIELMNNFYGLKGNATVKDLYDAHGIATGTCVILSIPYEL